LLLRLQLIQNQLVTGESLDSFFNQACDILTQRLKCTMARVSLLDRNQSTLMSHACRTIRPIVDDLDAVDLAAVASHGRRRQEADADQSGRSGIADATAGIDGGVDPEYQVGHAGPDSGR